MATLKVPLSPHGASVSTRGPIGRSSSMQAGSEKTRLGKRGLDTYCIRNGYCIYCKRVERSSEHKILLVGQHDAETLCHCLHPN